MILTEDNYVLDIINEIISMESPLRDIAYTYKYEKINILI